MARHNTPATEETVIAQGLHVKGDMQCQADVWFSGSIEGNIAAEGNLVIGAEGQVEGNVEATNIEIAGSIKGSVHAKGKLMLRHSARVEGTVTCKVLTVEEGANLSGKVTASSSTINTDKPNHNGS